MTLSKSSISVALLGALLITNCLWAYQCLNRERETGATATLLEACGPTEQDAELADAIVHPLVAAINASGRGANKESILREASLSGRQDKSFCIDAVNVARVRGVGFKFNEVGKLVGASTSMCPP